MDHVVVAGVLIEDGRVLLGHRNPTRRWYPDVWDLPGGHVEAGESAAGALARELAEEIGVRVVATDPAPVVEITKPGLAMTVWLVRAWTGEPVNRQPDEHDAIGWFAAADLAGLALAHPAYDRLLLSLLDRP